MELITGRKRRDLSPIELDPSTSRSAVGVIKIGNVLFSEKCPLGCTASLVALTRARPEQHGVIHAVGTAVALLGKGAALPLQSHRTDGKQSFDWFEERSRTNSEAGEPLARRTARSLAAHQHALG